MTISYFGYGSLVNVATLNPNCTVTPGVLKGWVREWRLSGAAFEGRGVCGLTIRPQANVSIRGVLAREPREGLEALERREQRYDKVSDVGSTFECEAQGSAGPDDMFLFRSKPEHTKWGSAETPILQTYLDCVMQGFHNFWGFEGVDHFLATTEGWHVPILKDRDRPIYPRAQKIGSDLLGQFDERLTALSVQYVEPNDKG